MLVIVQSNLNYIWLIGYNTLDSITLKHYRAIWALCKHPVSVMVNFYCLNLRSYDVQPRWTWSHWLWLHCDWIVRADWTQHYNDSVCVLRKVPVNANHCCTLLLIAAHDIKLFIKWSSLIKKQWSKGKQSSGWHLPPLVCEHWKFPVIYPLRFILPHIHHTLHYSSRKQRAAYHS